MPSIPARKRHEVHHDQAGSGIFALSAAGRPAVFSVAGLRITLPIGRARIAVVDEVGFELAPGEIMGLVGESGCGKSLTGAALLGMAPGLRGHVEAQKMEVCGQNLGKLDEAGWRKVRGHTMSMIFQEPLTALDPVFSIGSQMREVIRRHQGSKRQAATATETATRMLETVGLADPERILRAYPHELSGGMRQRIMIAMAMSCKPRVLIADEPTTALDVTTQAQILQIIRRMAREAETAVLLITHDLGVVAEICDRAMVMYCGRIVEEGPVSRLFSHPAHPYTAGLLAAVPRLTQGPVEPVRGIPGSVPGVAHRLAGCGFHNRCSQAGTICASQTPELRVDPNTLPGPSRDPAASAHRFACHFPLHYDPDGSRLHQVPERIGDQ